MDQLLSVQGLVKAFSRGSIFSRDKIIAVDHISFNTRPAEIFALAGESGCGKSTTARMVLGFEEPTAGVIKYKGNVKAQREKVWITEGVQAIFQDPFATFNPLRIVDNYFFETVFQYNLTRSRPEAIRIIDTKLRLVGLTFEEIAGKYPNEFSGGQLQRISIARALLTDPSLLIADEPVSMVDASLRMAIVNLFKNLRDEFGVSVLYITHDLATAYYVCDRIAVMFRGHIVEMGPVEQVLVHPSHPYTQLLRESLPEADPDKRWKDRVKLTETEEQEYMRTGCKFAGRCPKAMEICRNKVPADYMVESALVKCHLFGGKT